MNKREVHFNSSILCLLTLCSIIPSHQLEPIEFTFVIGKREVSCQIRDIVQLAIDLYLDPRSEENLAKTFEPKFLNGERIYAELNTGELWRNAQASIPSRGLMLAIIGFTDSTNVTRNGKTSAYPFIIFLGNHNEQTRRQVWAKRVVAYIPSIADENPGKEGTEELKRGELELKHKIFGAILEPIRKYQERFGFFPFFPFSLFSSFIRT